MSLILFYVCGWKESWYLILLYLWSKSFRCFNNVFFFFDQGYPKPLIGRKGGNFVLKIHYQTWIWLSRILTGQELGSQISLPEIIPKPIPFVLSLVTFNMIISFLVFLIKCHDDWVLLLILGHKNAVNMPLWIGHVVYLNFFLWGEGWLIFKIIIIFIIVTTPTRQQLNSIST